LHISTADTALSLYMFVSTSSYGGAWSCAHAAAALVHDPGKPVSRSLVARPLAIAIMSLKRKRDLKLATRSAIYDLIVSFFDVLAKGIVYVDIKGSLDVHVGDVMLTLPYQLDHVPVCPKGADNCDKFFPQP